MEENKKEKDEIKEEKNTVEEKDEQTKLKDTILMQKEKELDVTSVEPTRLKKQLLNYKKEVQSNLINLKGGRIWQ